MKKILLVAATHGNETIGIEAIEKLKNKNLDKYFDVLIGNPKALEKKVRFIDYDLNRAYPGDPNSPIYEKRLANINFETAQNYDYIIDLHSTKAADNDFIIIVNQELQKDFPLKLIDLDTVLFWPEPKGPLSDVLKNTIELEFGLKNRDYYEAVLKMAKILENFILGVNRLEAINFSDKSFYQVYDKLLEKDLKVDIKNLKDFKPIVNNNEQFLPLLVKSYLKEGIVCYKMKKN